MRFATRRRFCRAVFCTLGVLPTLLVIGTAVLIHTPAYRAAQTAQWRSQLAAHLGLEIEVGTIDWSNTAELVVRNIQLRDPESHICLAHARSATIVQSTRGPIIRLGQPEIDFQRLPRLVNILHEHLLLRSADRGGSFQLSTATLLLQKAPQSESVLDLQFVLDVKEDGSEVFIEFQPTSLEKRNCEKYDPRSGDEPQRNHVRLRVVRNRQLDPPATGWELHTGAVEVPCSLAQAWLPQAEELGIACAFQGSVWAERSTLGWEAEISGTFRQLDLDALVTRRFPHKLSGIADLTLHRLVVHHGRIAEARGRILSPGGVISQTLLHAAEKHLGLKNFAPSSEAISLSYGLLAFEFSLDKSGLRVVGGRDQEQTILADSQGPLLSSQGATKVPPQALVRLLVPLTDLQVPAAKETTALLQTLPLPAVNPAPTATARRHTPLRLLRE